MNGIQSLLPGQGGAPQGPMPGQAQAPGQAPMPGMQPRPQGPQQGIQSLTPNLMQMDIQQLQSELMNPGSSIPKFALLSTIDRKIKERQAMQAAQGMSAQQQNAMQPPGSVAEQVLAAAQQVPEADATQTLRAKAQQLMNSGRLAEASYVLDQIKEQEAKEFTQQRYAGGGIVAFAPGGEAQASPVVDQMEVERILRKGPMMRTPEENDYLRRAGIAVTQRQPAPPGSAVARVDEALKAPFIREAITSGALKLSPEELRQRTDPGALTEKVYRALGGEQAGVASEEPLLEPSQLSAIERAYSDTSRTGDIYRPPASAARPPAARPDTRTKPITRPASGIAAAQPAPASSAFQPTMGPDIYEKLEADAIAAAKKRGEIPEDVMSGRRGIETLVAEQLKAQREDMAARRKAAEEQRAKAMGAEGFGARELFEIAGAIDPRRGYVMGSLGKGLAGVQTRQATEREAARKEFAQFERDERTERTLLNQMAVAEKTRAQAILEGDMNRANALTKELEDLKVAFQRNRDEKAQREFMNALEQRKVAATEESARAETAKARAAQTAAAQRGEAKDITAYEKARLRGQAADDVEANKNLPVMIMRARQEAEKRGQAFDEQAFKQSLIEQRFRYLMGQTSAVPDAGAGQRVIDFSAIK